MTLTVDSEVMRALLAMGELPPPPERGDAIGLRESTTGTLEYIASLEPAAPGVEAVDYFVDVNGGKILVRWYTPMERSSTAAVVYAHGGGMVCGSVDNYDTLVRRYVHETGVPFLSVDYRLAPEFPGTTPVNDTFAALQWLIERTDELGISPDRIAVMGDSGGGGVAAGTAIAARDAGVLLARQILIYPMLDDRNLEPDETIAPFAVWSYDANYTGWHALLGHQLGTADVSPLSAPARLTDFSGLAPAYVEVGELDIFRDEDVAYAQAIHSAGISTELHVHPGVPHAFERLAGESEIAHRAYADRYRNIRGL